MIFVKDLPHYAAVWEIKEKKSEKYLDVRITTSEKMTDRDGNVIKDDNGKDKYETSSWFARIVGKALTNLKDLKETDRIKFSSFKVTNIYDKEKKQSYLNMTIFDAELLRHEAKPTSETGNKKVNTESDIESDPF